MRVVELFGKYLTIFLHPVEAHKAFRKRHTKDLTNEEEGAEEETQYLNQLTPLSFVELLSVSWFFVVIEGFYTLFLFLITGELGKFAAIFIVANVVLFPLQLFLYVKIWEILISCCIKLYGFEINMRKSVSEVVCSSATSNICLPIPILGSHLRFLAGLFLIFIGLKKNCNFSTSQGIFAISFPFC